MWSLSTSRYRQSWLVFARSAAVQNAEPRPPPVGRGSWVALTYVRVNGYSSSGRSQPDRLGEAADRVRRAAGGRPVGRGGVLHRPRQRLHQPRRARPDRARPVPGAGQVVQRLAVGGHERVQVDQVRYPVGDVLEGAGHDHAAVGEAEQHDVGQVLVEDRVHHVEHVGGQVDLRRRQVGALSDAGQGRGEHLVPRLAQRPADQTEAPRPAPRPVHQNNCRHGADARPARTAPGNVPPPQFHRRGHEVGAVRSRPA